MERTEFSDEELVEFIAQRQSWAIAALYDRYARLVFSLALRVLRDAAVAEEVVQEVFAKVWYKADSFDPRRSKFSTWLIGIARNQCIDELRRRSARPQTSPADESLTLDDPVTDPADAAIASIEQARVRKALQQIPLEEREIIYDAYFKGLTLREIAERKGQPLGTVKTRLYRGMERLRALLVQD